MAASDKTDATLLLWDTTAEPSAFDPMTGSATARR
jgi:hypothetical protein